MTDHLPSKDLLDRLHRFTQADFPPPPETLQLAMDAKREIERLSRPAHEREPPHCSNCSCLLGPEPTHYAFLIKRPRDKEAWPTIFACRDGAEGYEHRASPVVPVCLSTEDAGRPRSSAEPAVGPDEVLVALKRPEGYEDVHPELVAEDAIRPEWPEYRTIQRAAQPPGDGQE